MPQYLIPSKALTKREGVIIGLIGGCIVAMCYLVVDMVRGIPFLTPSVLGEVILFRRSSPSQQPDIVAVLLYTVFHFSVFMLFGIAVAAVAGWARTNAVARYGILQLFVAFVIFAWGVLAFMNDATRGYFPLPLVLASNLLAAVAMGWWLWIQHPSLRSAIRGNPLGGSDRNDVTSALRTGTPHRPPVR